MKTLLVMRHAKSSWREEDLADHERPLNARGRRDGPRMGEWLAAQGLAPDLVVTSSARRACATAELVAAQLDPPPPLLVEADLYHAHPDAYLDAARRHGAGDRVLLVGHNPGVEDLIQELCGVWERMPTAAVAVLELAIESWASLPSPPAATLAAHVRPKDLPPVD